MARPLALLALLLALAPALLRAQAGGWAGCYDLDLAAWDRPVEGGDTLSYAPPPRIRLDTARASYPWDPDVRTIEPAPGSPPSIHRYAVWKPFHADSVKLTWSTGFAGVNMRMGREGRALRGQAVTFVDTQYQPHTADVIVHPVACDAPMPPEQASWRRFPRSVRLANGITLALGGPVPDALDLEAERPDLHAVREAPVGVFSGATHAGIGVVRDSVSGIMVYYPPDQDFGTLVERLTDALGAPTSRWSAPSGSQVAMWRGRDSSLAAVQSTLASGETEVTVRLYP